LVLAVVGQVEGRFLSGWWVELGRVSVAVGILSLGGRKGRQNS